MLASWLSCVSCFLVFFVNFKCGVLDQVWYLIASIPDICLPNYDFNIDSVEIKCGDNVSLLDNY